MINPVTGTLPSDWKSHVVSRRTDVYVGEDETLIPQSQIIMNSPEITQSVCVDGKFHLGGVISSRFTFTVNTDCITFGDDRLKVYEHIVLDDNSEYDIPQGTYFVDRTDSVITENGNVFEGRYVAYDAFSRLDKVVTMDEANGWRTAHGSPAGETIANLIDFITNVINTGYGSDLSKWLMISSASKTYIAGCDNNERPYINIEREENTYYEYGYYLHKAARNGNTYRDVLSSIAVMISGAFIMDRSYTDSLRYKLVTFRAGASPVITLTASDRIRSSIDTQGGKPIIREINYDSATVTDPISETIYTDAKLSLGDLAIVQTPGTSARAIQSDHVLNSAMLTISKWLCGWITQSGNPVKVYEPLTLTSAEVEYFGDPTLEAGDFIRCTTNSGNTDFYVLQHVYRLHRPSMIYSYAEVNNSTYSSTSSPSYGEVGRVSGNTAAMAAQIAKLSESNQDFSGEIAELQDDIDDINTDISALDTRLTAAETAIASISTDVVYSTDERLIGSWIDGSELYEKTVVIPALGDGSTRSVSTAHLIDFLGEVVESRGMLVASRTFRPLQSIPIGSDGTSVLPESGVSYSIDKNNITVVSGMDDLSDCKAYVTLRYTKPQEYKRLEYIRSDGNAYIDTDITGLNAATDYIEAEMSFGTLNHTGDGTCLFGCATLDNGHWTMYGVLGDAYNNNASMRNDHFMFFVNYSTGGSGTIKRMSVVVNGDSSSKLLFSVKTPQSTITNLVTGTVYYPRIIDNNYDATSLQPIDFAQTASFTVFAGQYYRAAGDSIYYYCVRNTACYGIKIYRNNALIHELIPVERQFDGELGLLDKITDKFYTNAGTGTFDKGNYISS